VGSVSHVRNREVVFVCGPDRRAAERALQGALPIAV
jgi:hypothetical protein